MISLCDLVCYCGRNSHPNGYVVPSLPSSVFIQESTHSSPPLNTYLSNTYFLAKAMVSQHHRRSRSPSPAPTTHVSGYSHMNHSPLYNPSMNPNNAGDRSNGGNARITAEDNTQNRFELFLLADGERKVSEEADTRKLSFFVFVQINRYPLFLHNSLYYNTISIIHRGLPSLCRSDSSLQPYASLGQR